MSDTPRFRPLDHLEQFAYWFHQQSAAPVCPFDGVSFVGDFAQVVLRREGPYQVQLALCRPNSEINDHSHPNVDTIVVYVTGQIYFRIDGKPVYLPGEITKTANDRCSHAGRALRILPGQSHGASIGPVGGAFLTIQHWLDGNPKSVELDWDGPPLSDDHDRALKAAGTDLVP